MIKRTKSIAVGFTSIATFVTSMALILSNGGSLLTWLIKADAPEKVDTQHALVLDSSWGYNGESSKVKRSNNGNNFTFEFSNSSKFGHADADSAFTTMEDGLYISNSYTSDTYHNAINGVTQVYVKGTSSNSKDGITVYAHYDNQTYCSVGVNDERIIGSLNELIGFQPTKYITIQFEGIDDIESIEIGYSCNESDAPDFSMQGGGQNTDGNGLFQSMTGLTTELAVGTAVHVKMDVKVTGTFDSESCEVYWVDAVWSQAGGESDKSRTSIKSLVVNNGDTDWHTIEFDANVRNFPNLRYNTKYVTKSTTKFGNAVYLIAVTHASLNSFDYKNVIITKQYDSLISGGARNPANGFYQSMTGLSTNLAVGTSVEVEMDVRVTGSFNESSSIYVVDSVYSVSGGERNSVKNIKNIIVTEDTGWHHVSFVGTIRNFPCLRNNSAYTVTDTSMFGNAVYLLTENNSVDAFDYKNVVMRTVISAPAAQKDSSGNYYTSYIGFSVSGFAEGADVHVSLDMYYTGGTDSNTVVYALDKSEIKWGGGAYADGLHKIKVVEEGGTFPTTAFTTFEFNTKVYTHSNAIHWGATGATFDVSTYGVCVLLCFKNATNATSPASFKNVVITAL